MVVRTKVEQVDVKTGAVLNTFASISEAARAMGAVPSSVHQAVKMGTMSAGYRWRPIPRVVPQQGPRARGRIARLEARSRPPRKSDLKAGLDRLEELAATAAKACSDRKAMEKGTLAKRGDAAAEGLDAVERDYRIFEELAALAALEARGWRAKVERLEKREQEAASKARQRASTLRQEVTRLREQVRQEHAEERTAERAKRPLETGARPEAGPRRRFAVLRPPPAGAPEPEEPGAPRSSRGEASASEASLEGVLCGALAPKMQAALRWLDAQGLTSLEEVRECAMEEDFAAALDLKPAQQTLLLRRLENCLP